MGQVVRLEIVRIEAGTFGAERVVLGAERLGRLGVDHDRADLLAKPFRHGLVGRGVQHLVVEDAEDLDQLARLPSSFETLLAHLFGSGGPADVGDLARDTGPRVLGLLPIGGPIRRQRGQAFRRGWPVASRDREVRRALEDRELGGLGRDQRDRLDTRRSGADDGHPLAVEVDALVGPGAGEVDLAPEPLGSLDVRRLGEGEASAGHHVEAAAQLRLAVGSDVPTVDGRIPDGRLDAGGELDVTAQVVAIGHEL
jgi:hypothetical protein